ncbi:MAG: cupredoxin domain-containing protein [Janthinobacterium lividum]
MKCATMVLLATAAVAVPALAQSGGPASRMRPQPIAITMTDHGFAPSRFSLRGGARYVLRIANRSGTGHNLTQNAFFANAGIAPEDCRAANGGQISLRPGESVVIRLRAPDTRPGGTYQFTSTVLGDAGKDYKGVFVIR